MLTLPHISAAEVLSKPCPFSCKTEGYKKKRCKDWREDNTCYIEVTKGKVKGAGKVQSKPCPFNCKSAGIRKKKCRDWKEGTTCFVEDLR